MNGSPLFLGYEAVINLQKEQIDDFGGLHGIGDEGAIRSAVAAPQNAYFYGRPSLCELAASYAFHLVKNHGFLDGNKRIALEAALDFLDQNGWDIEASATELHQAMFRLAASEISEDQFSQFLESKAKKQGLLARLKSWFG